MSTWTAEELAQLTAADELQISVTHTSAKSGRWVTIWGVSVGEQVYVRTWYRRDRGWFASALVSRRARIRFPGVECDIDVVDVGDARDQPRQEIDVAYRTKYGHFGAATVDRMTSDEAAAATLRFTPAKTSTAVRDTP